MKTWTCWQARRRIPRWIRGRCSTPEATAIAAHVATCPACAADAALSVALADAAGPGAPVTATGRHEALWTCVAQAVTVESALHAPRSTPSNLPLRGGGHGKAAPSGLPLVGGGWRGWSPERRLALALATIALILGLSLGGHWRARPRDRQSHTAARFDLALWERQPLMENPMGPTTERLLALLEDTR